MTSNLKGKFTNDTYEQFDLFRMNEIDRDIDGMASETKAALNGQLFPADKVTLDEKGKSFVYDFKEEKEIQKIELFKTNLERKSRIRERDLHIYIKQNETDGWSELTPDNWNYVVDPKNQSIHFNLKETLKTRFIKIRTIWDDRDLDNNNVSDYVTFSNDSVQKMIRIWTLENERNEEYDYDRNSNRKSITENGKNRSYTYYKNAAEGNTARVMSDGKWYYTYDDNGNRTARAAKAKNENNKVTLDKTGEYWEYTWDYHNRLVKVQQFNAPDNAQNVKVEYTYDVMNRRIERTSYTSGTSVKTQYAYGRNGAITYQKKTVGEAVTTRSFVYLNNRIAGFMDKTEDGIEIIRYAVTDIQGSVTEVYDDNNQLLWKSGYTAFGIKASETTKLLDFDGLYTGCDSDAETGLSYHWNRWRSEDGDSWLSEDPVRDGMNWYGYAGQNPINFTDIDGYSTTRDDWAYQQRMEAENSETYAKTFELERQAAVDNQGISNVEYNRYNQDGTPKNPGYEDTQNKLNYFVHVFENEQNKIIKKTFRQKEIERKYGYGNFLCLITSILNAYVSDGVVTQRFMDREFGGIIRNNLKIDGKLADLEKFSRQIASALGLDKFYNYRYPAANNFEQLFLNSVDDFYASDFKYGIVNCMKPGRIAPANNKNFDHYELILNNPDGDGYIFNPGEGDGIGDYYIVNIAPLYYQNL